MPVDPDGTVRDIVMCVKPDLLPKVYEALEVMMSEDKVNTYVLCCTAMMSDPRIAKDCPVCKMTVNAETPLTLDRP